jgi:hypothetical protein
MRMVCLQRILASLGIFIWIFASRMKLLKRAAMHQRWDEGNVILNPAADRTLITVFVIFLTLSAGW